MNVPGTQLVERVRCRVGATVWWVLGRLVRVLVGAICVSLWIGCSAQARPIDDAARAEAASNGASGPEIGDVMAAPANAIALREPADVGCSSGCAPLGTELAQAVANDLTALPLDPYLQRSLSGTFYHGVDYLRIGLETKADGMMAYSAAYIAPTQSDGASRQRDGIDWQIEFLLLFGALLAGGGVVLWLLWQNRGTD